MPEPQKSRLTLSFRLHHGCLWSGSSLGGTEQPHHLSPTALQSLEMFSTGLTCDLSAHLSSFASEGLLMTYFWIHTGLTTDTSVAYSKSKSSAQFVQQVGFLDQSLEAVPDSAPSQLTDMC